MPLPFFRSALLVVVVAHQALRHDKRLTGDDIKGDVLQGAVLLRNAGIHLACMLAFVAQKRLAELGSAT